MGTALVIGNIHKTVIELGSSDYIKRTIKPILLVQNASSEATLD